MRVAAILAALLVGGVYLFTVQVGNEPIAFHKGNLAGYYNYLAQGLTAGHLYLPVEPAPELLAMQNPYDPKIDDSLKLWDVALYNRRYYLYHGIGPALLAFVPFRLITGYDLPEQAANWAFAFFGYLFSLGTFLLLLNKSGRRPAAWKAFFAFLALGLCQNVPFLLNRTWVYEVAIIGGYFCVSAGLYFLVRGWASAAGFFFGMAVACRPHLGLIGVFALGLLIVQRKRLIGFVTPFVLVGLGLCIYNFERFENPFQFGNKYILGNVDQNEVHWSLRKAKTSLHFMLTQKPVTTPEFPWFHGAQRPKDLPKEHAFEPLVGGLWLAPFMLFALLSVPRREARSYWILLLVSGAGVLLFIAGTGWSIQRYETDFLPLFVLAALVSAMANWASAASLLLIIPGLVISLAFGFDGPYEEVIARHPKRFYTAARFLSPIRRYRPMLNPRIERTFIRDEYRPDGTRDVLVGAGPTAARYELRFEQVSGKPLLFSQFGPLQERWRSVELPPSNGPRVLHVVYEPETERFIVTQNEVPVLIHPVQWLVTAPSEIYLGEPKR